MLVQVTFSFFFIKTKIESLKLILLSAIYYSFSESACEQLRVSQYATDYLKKYGYLRELAPGLRHSNEATTIVLEQLDYVLFNPYYHSFSYSGDDACLQRKFSKNTKALKL